MIKYNIIDYDVKMDLKNKVLYRTCWKLYPLIENYIMERVRSSSPEVYDWYLKSIYPNIFSNTSLDFISDMVVIDHRDYDI